MDTKLRKSYQIPLMQKSSFIGKKYKYFQSPHRKVYKRGSRYKTNRRKLQYSLLEEYGFTIPERIPELIDQGKRELPLIGSNDRMSIIAPSDIKDIPKKVYGQDWEAYNQAQTKEKILFMELLNELTSLIPPMKHEGRGRKPTPVSEMIFSICLKIYLDFSSRRIESDIQEAQRLGYISTIPHFNTILKYLNNPILAKVFKELITVTALPLKQIEENFAVDASGFSTSLYKPWMHARTGLSSRRLYKKAHLFIGTKTNVITSVEVTDGYVNDTTMFRTLLFDSAKNFNLKEVTADLGYSSRENLGLVSSIGAIPFIPFKKNVKGNPEGVMIWRLMYKYFKEHKEDFMMHYHRRSNVESVFSMIKRKQGCNLRTKNDVAQVNEIMCKCLVHNICVLIQEMFELGIRVDFKEVAPDEFMCKIKL